MSEPTARQLPARDVLDAAHTCLLLFDTLNGYLAQREGGIKPEVAPQVANMSRLLDATRASGAMVAYAAAAHRADGGMHRPIWTDTDGRLEPVAELRHWTPPVLAGDWTGGIPKEIAPAASDFIVPKYRWSAFTGTYLDLALRAHEVDTIVIAGGSTDVGVAATAYSARDLDYNVVVASDACTYNVKDNHDQFMRRIFPRMGRVRTTEQIVAMLRR